MNIVTRCGFIILKKEGGLNNGYARTAHIGNL